MTFLALLKDRGTYVCHDCDYNVVGRNEKIQILEFHYDRLVLCCYGQDKRLGQIFR